MSSQFSRKGAFTEEDGVDAMPPRPMVRMMWDLFLSHRAAKWSLAVLVAFGVLALAAPLLSQALGIDPERQNVLFRYQPFGAVGLLDPVEQEARLKELIAKHPDEAARLAAQVKRAGLVAPQEPDGEVLYLLHERLQGDGEMLLKLEAFKTEEARRFLEIRKSFQTRAWLGTDELGRDVLARLLFGARVTLAVGALASLSAGLLGLIVGAVAGYCGGIVDGLLMRLVDSLLALPAFPLQILLAAIDFKRLPLFQSFLTGETESLFKILVVLVTFGWMGAARLVRGQVLSVRESEYVLAARLVGATNARVIFLHVVPNVLGPLVVQTTLGAGNAMMAETGLSFLGLGIQPPMPSWGNMLNNAMELVSSAPFLAFAPGFLIFVVVICVNFVGDGLRDALDPKGLRR